LQASLKKKAGAVIESIEGYQMMPEQKYRVRTIRHHLEFIEKSIHKLDDMLNVLVSPLSVSICNDYIRQ
jgi:hypothetical protein